MDDSDFSQRLNCGVNCYNFPMGVEQERLVATSIEAPITHHLLALGRIAVKLAGWVERVEAACHVANTAAAVEVNRNVPDVAIAAASAVVEAVAYA